MSEVQAEWGGCAWNSRTLEAAIGGSRVQSSPGYTYHETLCKGGEEGKKEREGKKKEN